jgi:broad specificity phosphatase PhoE
MIPPVSFYFLRHGETDYNLTGRMQGWADVPLNATGESQADAQRPAIAALGLGSIAASSLARAWRTAEIVGRGLAVPRTAVEELREFDVGPFEGTDISDWVNDWRAGKLIGGVEPFADFCVRVERGMNRALDLDHPVLVVAHGGVYWALEALLGLPGPTRVPNAVVVRFDPPTAGNERWGVSFGAGERKSGTGRPSLSERAAAPAMSTDLAPGVKT